MNTNAISGFLRNYISFKIKVSSIAFTSIQLCHVYIGMIYLRYIDVKIIVELKPRHLLQYDKIMVAAEMILLLKCRRIVITTQ